MGFGMNLLRIRQIVNYKYNINVVTVGAFCYTISLVSSGVVNKMYVTFPAVYFFTHPFNPDAHFNFNKHSYVNRSKVY